MYLFVTLENLKTLDINFASQQSQNFLISIKTWLVV